MNERLSLARGPTGVAGGDLARTALSLPTDLTTPYAKLVYLYLWFVRRADVREISRCLDVPQIRLYPVVESLESAGYLERSGTVYAFAG